MKTILCFGDSNTWGYNPDTQGRHNYKDRWVTVLQNKLGGDYLVIPEGLNGRTTVFDDPFSPGRDGSAVLEILLDSHHPVDLLIIMLGTNDTKEYFSTNSWRIGRGMSRLVEIARKSDCGPDGGAPGILVVAPPPLETFDENMGPHFENARQSSLGLAKEYKAVAKEYSCHYFDAGTISDFKSADGVHFDVSGHKRMGEGMAERILGLFDNV